MFKILGISCGVLLLTGCGNSGKVLTCTAEEGESGKIEIQMGFNADGTELQNIRTVMEGDASDSIDEISSLSSDEICDEINLPFATCKANITGSKVHLEGTVAARDIDEVFSEVDDSITYNSIKEAAEADGFTCN